MKAKTRVLPILLGIAAILLMLLLGFCAGKLYMQTDEGKAWFSCEDEK